MTGAAAATPSTPARSTAVLHGRLISPGAGIALGYLIGLLGRGCHEHRRQGDLFGLIRWQDE
jgi:hypothetical protein